MRRNFTLTPMFAITLLGGSALIANAALIAQTPSPSPAPVAAKTAAPAQPMLPPGKADPSLITGGTYQVEPGHTQVAFSYDHMKITPNFGLIAGPSTGTLILDPKAPERAKVSVTFPVANLRTAIPALDEHLMKPDFFDAAKFPSATFTSTGVAVSGTSATITGNLTIKGITKPVTLAATFYGVGPYPVGSKEVLGFSANGAIKRSDFGMGMAVPMVGDDIELKITAAFQK